MERTRFEEAITFSFISFLLCLLLEIVIVPAAGVVMFVAAVIVGVVLAVVVVVGVVVEVVVVLEIVVAVVGVVDVDVIGSP